MKKLSNLTIWILTALVAGIAFGAVLPGPAKECAIFGTIFLRLIKSIIAPLLFATLVHGIAGTGNVKTMGRIGGESDPVLRDRHSLSRCSRRFGELPI